VVALLGAHTPLLICQRKVLMPVESPEAVVDVAVLLDKVEEPPRTVQLPLPTAGVFAVRTTDVLQSVWLAMTEALEGAASRCTVTVAVEGGHTPLLTFHSKLLMPTDNDEAVTVVAVLLLRVELPDKTVQLPVPTAGAVELITALLEHTAWLAEVKAVLGGISL
jgi:hypothetical protein